MRKKDAASDSASEWSSVPPGRITPLDVQQKEFHVTRLGAGYRMREVDEFLDEVTDTLSALITENERLLRGSGAPDADTGAPSDTPAVATDEADRVPVEAFLRRERGFLQDLGGLVQSHAEELRSMVREVRRAAPEAAEPAKAEPVADEPAPITAAPSEPGGEADAPEPIVAEEPAPAEEATPASESVDVTGEPAADVADDEDGGDPRTTSRAVADQPIRLEEPEPARTRRSEEKDEGDSLRELFWGEE